MYHQNLFSWGKCSWWKKVPWRREMATISTEMGILGGMAFSTNPDPWFPKEPRTNFSASRMSLKWRLFETKRHLASNSHPPNLSDTTKMGEVLWIHMHLHNQWTKVALSSLREILSDIPPKSRQTCTRCVLCGFATQNFMCYRLRYGTVYISPSVPWVKQCFIEETGCFCFLCCFWFSVPICMDRPALPDCAAQNYVNSNLIKCAVVQCLLNWTKTSLCFFDEHFRFGFRSGIVEKCQVQSARLDGSNLLLLQFLLLLPLCCCFETKRRLDFFFEFLEHFLSLQVIVKISLSAWPCLMWGKVFRQFGHASPAGPSWFSKLVFFVWTTFPKNDIRHPTVVSFSQRQ